MKITQEKLDAYQKEFNELNEKHGITLTAEAFIKDGLIVARLAANELKKPEEEKSEDAE